ncbi:hypothetical protein [Streptomyces olivochromogenes]|uniref:Uncharacterized protein n=1 Tax=Streptomyces olivochromogenes TaxID=1963 RepID=A0A250V6F7_STROL|nr:hypothetical protein [Streptomyces olivochromogenes]KUN48418.1 hypothetical protein AQJ27_06520 [Streptomyces olivochromogenes]GAX49767.1 hypothetical protein SO3561_01256 [Streptomyces olivochromogenes]
MRIARALLRHELRLFASLLLWVTRRTHGTGDGRPFGYARGLGAMMGGLAFVCVVETVGMAVLLRGWPVVHAVVLVLDVYTVLMVVGMYAACVTRPHILDSTHLRVRDRAHVDLRIPLADIAVVRRELRTTHEAAEGELNLAVGAQTDVTIELAAPVPHFTFLGRERRIRLVRLHADDPDELARALTRARNVPSPSPGRPG